MNEIARYERNMEMDRYRVLRSTRDRVLESLGADALTQHLLFHMTSDDRKMAIAEMSDDHLLNLLRRSFNKMAQLRKQAEAAANAQSSMSEFQRKMYGVKKVNPEVAATAVQQAYFKMLPFIGEAALRGLNISNLLADALGRKPERMVVTAGMNELLSDDPYTALMDDGLEVEGPDWDSVTMGPRV